MSKSFQKLSFLLSSSWLGLGVLSTALAFVGLMYDIVSLALVIPLLVVLWSGYVVIQRIPQLGTSEKLLLVAIAGVWLLHSTGILVPETGFDAVWYHLPIANEIAEAHRLVYLPSLYQSLNPLFTDILFVLGYQIANSVGSKIVAFALGLSLILTTYSLSRLFLSRYWSLWVVLLISTFQVIAWQSTSFYVDIGKALWEIAALWMVFSIKKNVLPVRSRYTWLIVGAFIGASIATKAFSILLLPVFLFIIWLIVDESKSKAITHSLVGIFLVAAPFYVRTWWYSGNILLSPTLHLNKLEEIGGNSNAVGYILQRLQELPLSLFQLTWGVTDYVSIIFLVFAPLLVWFIWRKKGDVCVQGLALFSLGQWAVWWFVPPLSTRYALSGFVVLTILTVIAISKWLENHAHYTSAVLLALILAVSINVAPRLYVLRRNILYLVGTQTKTEYLQQFKDGNIDTHLVKWYQLTSF